MSVACRIAGVSALCLALVACGRDPGPVPRSEELALRTHGAISRYHAVLNSPYSVPLIQNGYIVGIEKAPKDAIGIGKGHDGDLLKRPDRIPGSGNPGDLELQQSLFDRVMDDPKAMFVSHVLRYHGDASGQSIQPEILYSAYTTDALPRSPECVPDVGATTHYERGWLALRCLEAQIRRDIARAKRPYTHLVFLSMGWNNDQFESIERYNAILQNTRTASRGAFNPLVIGLTWPSVWGGTSVVDLANRALHVGSYPVKADDADEIGFTVANHILNALMPTIERDTGIKPVALGHSMGARILTRAYYSADLLKKRLPYARHKPLVIGLQGAFSANRFRPEHRLIWPVRLVFSGEGGPYQDHAEPGGHVVLTWAEGDRANPAARLATGAAHVGARPGKEEFDRIEQDRARAGRPGLVVQHTWEDGKGFEQDCTSARAARKVLHIDASDTIKSHGDIRNAGVGRLVWRILDCFQP